MLHNMWGNNYLAEDLGDNMNSIEDVVAPVPSARLLPSFLGKQGGAERLSEDHCQMLNHFQSFHSHINVECNCKLGVTDATDL